MFGAANSWEDIHTFGFEEGRSATEIAAAIRFMASTAHEWCNELEVFVASMDAKHAFDNVTPENLSKAMKELGDQSGVGGGHSEGADSRKVWHFVPGNDSEWNSL